MTFPLYGDSFGQVAGQQHAYDQFFNGINQANRAALTDANNRNLDMAFRSRDIQAQDARTLEAQDEEAKRFALAQASGAQDRADQISQARAGQDYQNMAFKARQTNDAALLQLERDKLAAMQTGKTDPEEQALMLSQHLGELKTAADAAAQQADGNKLAIQSAISTAKKNGFKLSDDKRGNITFALDTQNPRAANGVTLESLNGKLAEYLKADKAAQAAALRAKHDFEKNLWNAKQYGVSHGIVVGDDGITTKSGSQYRFGPSGASSGATQTPNVRLSVDANGNVTHSYPEGGDHGDSSPTTTPTATQFTPPPASPATVGHASMDRDSYTPYPTEPTGILPASGRLAMSAWRAGYNAPVWAIKNLPTLGQVAGGVLDAGRYTSDALRMPAPYSPEYQNLMRQRAAQDARLKSVSGPIFNPDYLTPENF